MAVQCYSRAIERLYWLILPAWFIKGDSREFLRSLVA